jgi:hypothetical protein
MTFKPAIWQPVAIVLSAINLAAAGFAAAAAEPLHAGAHVALALAFGLWARRLGLRRSGEELTELGPRLETLEFEVGNLRQELSETQERLDFAERLLAQRPEPRRVEPEH